MVEFKNVYIAAKEGNIQWPILDIERITFDKTSLTGVQFKEAVGMWMNREKDQLSWRGMKALEEADAEIARLKGVITQITCIPYKEPTAPQPSAVPTSGTGTTPEDGRTLKQTVKDLEICTYPGMAKDIGDLTLRMDNLEMLHGGVGQKIGNFQKELKDQREDYHAHIRQFVEENAAAHKEINKALKSLKEDSSAELSQFARDTNQVLHEHKQINDTAREVSNERAVAIYIQMQDQIKGLEHRLRLAQDRIAEIHPSGCVPPAKSKPKSRLKTDRVKKVKP